ncbi:tRNA (guanine(10)-N(2))-methyltransferase TRMT11-like isoform X2 [Babylonia areolata]|uniref:tRNA (guanine(10)-N(2))-methyltransferase TRMT11-like isoform X2 n=1 Tax=Babylonia areolata TaxID=304850 RepID=UPI003FD0BB7F
MAAHIARNMASSWKRYIFHFANDHFDFKLAELKAIAATVGCQMHIDEDQYDKECPFLEVRLQSEEEGRKLMQRATLGRSLYELLAEGSTLSELCENLKKLPDSAKTLLQCCPKFEGSINLKTPEHSFHLLEYYGHEGTKPPDEPFWLYFGRWIADGQRDKIRQFHLQKRRFIGNTSMDAALSLIMANMGGVDRNHLVFDPFVGTGSLLVACAHHGAYVMGTDIDYMLIHAKARPSRHNQKKREKDESVYANLRQYGLESRYLDVLVADASRHDLWRSLPLFDAIITDPPYGIREASLKIGAETPEEAFVPEECKDNHHPQSVRYHLSDIFSDLLNFAARFLKLNGRLVYWLPVFRPKYSEANVARHPCLTLVSNCEQPLNTTISRRLITMEKTAEWHEDVLKGASVEVDHYGDKSFRERYFKANRTIVQEQQQSAASHTS